MGVVGLMKSVLELRNPLTLSRLFCFHSTRNKVYFYSPLDGMLDHHKVTPPTPPPTPHPHPYFIMPWGFIYSTTCKNTQLYYTPKCVISLTRCMYSWMERATVRVKHFAHEHNTLSWQALNTELSNQSKALTITSLNNAQNIISQVIKTFWWSEASLWKGFSGSNLVCMVQANSWET